MMPLLLILFGAALRIGMVLTGKSLWGDEFYTLDYAAVGGPLSDVLKYCLTTNHPPVYYLLIHGAAALSDQQEWAYRAVSCVPGILTVWAVYRLGKILCGQGPARLAAALAAVSPYLLQSSHEIRSYGLLTFLSAAAVLFYLKALKRPVYLFLYAAAAAVLPYVEHMGVFIVLGLTLAMAVLRQRRLWRTQAAVIALQIPWALLVVYQGVSDEGVLSAERVSEYWNAAWIVKKGVGIFWHLLFGYEYSMLTVEKIRGYLTSLSADFIVQGIGVTLLTAWMLVSLKRMRGARPQLFWLAVFVFLLPLALLLAAYPIRLGARYLGFAAPVFIVWTAWTLRTVKPSALAGAAAAVLLVANIEGSWTTLNLTTDAIHREDFKAMSRHVSEHLGPDTLVIGSRQNYRYYSRRLNLRTPARYLDDVLEADPERMTGVADVWLMDEVNMNPEVTRRILTRADTHLASLGFSNVLHRPFGGKDALAMASYYVKNEGSQE